MSALLNSYLGLKRGDKVRISFEATVGSVAMGGIYLARDGLAGEALWFGSQTLEQPSFQIETLDSHVGGRAYAFDGKGWIEIQRAALDAEGQTIHGIGWNGMVKGKIV